MPTVGTVHVELTASMKQLSQTLERARRELKRFGEQVQKDLGLKIEQQSPKMERYALQSSIALKKIHQELSTIRPSIDKATGEYESFKANSKQHRCKRSKWDRLLRSLFLA